MVTYKFTVAYIDETILSHTQPATAVTFIIDKIAVFKCSVLTGIDESSCARTVIIFIMTVIVSD